MLYIKKILLLLSSVSFFWIMFLIPHSYAYDQVFPSVKLRYGYGYYFTDTFNNDTNTRVGLDRLQVTFTEDADYNGGTNPTFPWTQSIRNKGFILESGESHLFTRSTPVYNVNYHPVTRKSNNIEIVYKTTHYEWRGGRWQGPYYHTEYQPYEITWCGDGIVDNYTDPSGSPIIETCDPADSNKQGWGNGGCSATCNPITIPTPSSCDTIDVNPITGTAPLVSNISCSGTNADSFRLDIIQGGQVIRSINSNLGSYNFTSAGNYTVQCFVNNTITSTACTQQVTVGQPEPEAYDLALRKTLSTSTPGPFNPGDSVSFDIRVFNQGDVASGPVTITDYIPTGLTLNDSNWIQSGNTATRNITNIPAGGDTTLTIRFTINAGVTGTLRNFAEISSDSGDDCDSTPDNINGNGTGESTGLINDDIGNGCNPGGDEDDHDVAEIVVGTISSACTGLTVSPSSARDSLTSTLTCTGNNATSFRIEVRNPNGDIVNTINSSSGSVTLPLIGGTTTNYSASCIVNNETPTPAVCQKTLSVTTGGGGGSNHSCVDIERRGENEVRCFGLNAFVMGITYTSSGATLQQSKDNLTTTDTGRVYADFTLPADATNIQCLASKDGLAPIAEGLQDWRGGQQCRFNENPICGDGVVDAGEQCDFGTPFTSDRWGSCGLPGTSRACRFPGGGGGTPPGGGGSTPDCSTPGVRCGVITIPDEGEFIFGPRGDIIVGHTQNPLAILGQHPILENNSNYDISFDRFCIKSMNNTLLTETVSNGSSDGEICVNIENRTIYPYEKLYLVQSDSGSYRVVNQFTYSSNFAFPQFLANKDAIPSGANYAETRLVTSVKDTLPLSSGGTQQFDFYNTFLAANLNVRVARPAVSTVGGGTSFVKSTTTSDVAKVTSGIAGMIANTNFVGTSVSSSGVSSDAAIVTDTNASSGDKNMQGGITLINTAVNTNFESYNGIENVFIKTGNHTFSSVPTGNGARTYIVENGDVTITGNIISNDNIAIIVRNGNIVIGKDVEQINATLMVLGDATKIRGQASEKQLRVNGALYGNIDELVANRYYIDGSGNSLSVGTIVSFGSNLLRRPAPLLSQFVGEYLNSQRVAR